MALYITFDNNTRALWHIGEPDPVRHANVSFVREVQADGHELQHINTRFSHIPHRINGRVVRWFGDDAKFIVGNLI